MGTSEQKWGPNGDPKTEKGPHGDRVPQMGTHLGAVQLMLVVPYCCQVQTKLRSQFLGPLRLWQCFTSPVQNVLAGRVSYSCVIKKSLLRKTKVANLMILVSLVILQGRIM